LRDYQARHRLAAVHVIRRAKIVLTLRPVGAYLAEMVDNLPRDMALFMLVTRTEPPSHWAGLRAIGSAIR
jgi:hypothetical protein